MTEYYRSMTKPAPGTAALLEEIRARQGDMDTTMILGHAKSNIDYFSRFSEEHLMASPSARCFRRNLRTAMCAELTDKWRLHDGATITRSIHPEWSLAVLPRSTFPRSVEVWYYRAGFSANPSRSFARKYIPTMKTTCRGCGYMNETMEHIILNCPCANVQREALRCRMQPLELSMRNILGVANAKAHAERFINDAKLHIKFKFILRLLT
jgi:hypothetical protein